MRTLLPLAIVLALVGCDELSSYDDPRDWGETTSTSRGFCTGISVRCEKRRVSQCEGGGCELVTGCQSAANQRCLSHVDVDVCEADADCFWIADGCEVLSDLCDIHSGEASCRADVDYDCTWAPECDGYAGSCGLIENEADCGRNLGCEWDPG
jgi:hypothetical protein